MKDKCSWQGIGTLMVITMCLVSILSPAMTQSSIPMLSNATDGETGGLLKSTPVLSPTPSLTPPEEQNSSPSPVPDQTPTPSPTPDQNNSSTPSPSPTPDQNNSSTPSPSPTPDQNNSSTPTPSPTLSHAAPTITLFAPSSPVQDTAGEPRTFNITTDQPVNVSWLLNSTEVFNQSNVTESIYTNTSSKTGTWNISAVATNANGTAMQTWIWNVSSQVTPTPTPGPTPSPSPMTNPASTPTPTPTPAPLKSPSSNVKPSTPFYIDGWVNYEDGAECYNPTVNIINTNTSENWQAETSAESNFFQLLVNNISKGDVLVFNASDGTEYTTATHKINQIEVTNSGLFDFNLNLALSGSALTVNVDLTPDDDTSTPGIQIINPDQSSKNKTVTIIANVTDLNGYENITSVIANITGPSIVAASPVSLELVSNTNATTATYNGNFKLANHLEGEYKVEIMATNTEGLTGTGSVIFSYSHGPDLIVMGISTPSYLVANASNTINAIIVNAGTARATEFNTALTANGIHIETVTVPSLNASDNKTVNFRWIPDREENYVLTVTVDPDSKITESNATNNNLSKTISVGAPDFTVTNLSFDPPAPLLGDTVTINADISNLGVESGTTTVKLYYDDIAIATETISLNAAESKNITASWTATIAGDHNISAYVDQQNSLPETNETNNNLTEQIFINGTDLAVTDINIPHSIYNPCFEDREVSFNATISNLGAIDATNITVYFKEAFGEGNTNGSVFFKKIITRLDSDESVTIPVNWTTGEFGWYTITASIPFNNSDNNETNNEKFKNVPVKAKWDFSVENVSVYPEEITETENVTIVATIGNFGLETGSVNVSFYINSTDFIGYRDERFIEIGRTEHPVYVEVDKTNSTSITWRANITGGDHLIFAVANPDNKLTEWPNEVQKLGDSFILKNQTLAGNNVKNGTLRVIKPNLTLKTLTLKPPQPIVGDLVNVSAMVVNEGTERANSNIGLYMEKKEAKSILKQGGDHWKKDEKHVLSNLSLSENMSMRVHIKYIYIHNKQDAYPPDWTDVFCGFDDIVRAYVNDTSVEFYVKSDDVADGQPIRTPLIDFNTSCGECLQWGMRGEERYCFKKGWEDIWTEWGYGKDFELKVIANGIFGIEIYIDTYQVQLGNQTVTLNPGESGTYNVTWNTRSLNPGENYTLMANVEDIVKQNETHMYGTDLAVTELVLNENYFDCDAVNITARINNSGLMNATEFLVSFTEIYVTIGSGNKIITPINATIPVTGLEAGGTINISVPWTASIRKIERELADDYTINASINPCENSEFEENKTNNYKKQSVHVNRARDFAVTNLSFVVNKETRAPDNGTVTLSLDEYVTLNATINITNIANRGGTVNVSFYIDDTQEIGTVINIPYDTGNATKTVALENWHVWNIGDVNIAGDHNITVVADPEDEIYELNESNNASRWQIYVDTPELTVTGLAFDPDKRIISKTDSINITVEVANYGNIDATNVSLVVYDCANRYIVDDDTTVYSRLYPGSETVQIKRDSATAMKLYLDLEIDDGGIGINDSNGNQILWYTKNYHGWTPWLDDNNITIEATGTENNSASARVSKLYYLEQNETIRRSTIDYIGINDSVRISLQQDWTASTVGERLITAVIDIENDIPEYDESNNSLARYITVQTADLTASDISLFWQNNGTRISDYDTIKHNDSVTIVANINSNGIEEADVRFLVDDITIDEEPGRSLVPNGTTSVSANWTAKVGTHVLKVEGDYNNEIVETNETDNINAKEIYVHGAEVKGNASWKSLGLHGTILFDPAQPYDEDDVKLTALINNSGRLTAANISAALLYDHKPSEDPFVKKLNAPPPRSIYRTYSNAVCIYLYMDINPRFYQVFSISAKNKAEVMRTDKSCWVLVPGDTVEIEECIKNIAGIEYNITFYPVYRANLTYAGNLTLNTNSSTTISMKVQNVTAGNHTVMLLIDPENKVPEDVDNKTDNIVPKEMVVQPTRDFTITEVIPGRPTIFDGDKVTLTANVSNMGYRNGTSKMRFLDYEHENRTYNYYFNRSINLSYLPVSPEDTLSGQYENLTIIHRPGVDAIELNFSSIRFSTALCLGEIRVFNETGVVLFSADPYDWLTVTNKKVLVPGETAYIYTRCADYYLNGYSTETKFPEEVCVTLNANVTWDESGNITTNWCESKNVTALWNATTGEHNITVMIDPDNEIIEMNETNNTYVLPVNVNASRDPEVLDLNYSVQNPAPGQDPGLPAEGDNLTITAVVRNNGTANASFSVDLWLDTIKDTSSAAVPNDWNITVEKSKTRYITFLSHTELALASGEKANVTANWANINVSGNPAYILRAIADPLDEIDESNENNDELNTRILMNYPDFNVSCFNAPTKDNNASVTIENIGAINASNVTVWLELCRHEHLDTTATIERGKTTLNITKTGANRIRIHFLELDVTRERAYVYVYGKGKEEPEVRYSEEHEELRNVWTPWVSGDTVIIDYCGAGFYIDECEWGDEYMTTLNLSAKEAVNVSLPESWNRYEGLAFLNATVDPYADIVEQREENNNKNTTIYVDLVLNAINIEENKLKAVVWSNDTVENGIAFPVSKFSITLEKEVNGSYEYIKKLWFNETIYGGEERDDVWFDIYECLNKHHFEVNNKSKIKLKVDFDGTIEELREDNNEKELEIGPDIVIGNIIKWPGYPVVGRHTCNISAILTNNGSLPAEDFFVNCSLNITYLNADGEIETDAVFLPEKPFPSLGLNGTEDGTGLLTFEWDPSGDYTAHLPYYDVSRIKIVADTDDRVIELDETNNEKVDPSSWRIYTETGYGANHPLETFKHNLEPLKRRVAYTTGTSYYLGGAAGEGGDADYGPVYFNNVYREGATPKLARLYVYWTGGMAVVEDPLRPGQKKQSPVPLDVEVTFNDNPLDEPDEIYSDHIFATTFDFGWGMYAYDVSGIINTDNTLSAIRRASGNVTRPSAIAGMGLLVLYEQDDIPLTTYWLNEGADVIWSSYESGLTPEECTTKANFSGSVFDLEKVNATLWTIVPFGDGGDDMNRLFFNTNGEWPGVWHSSESWPPGNDSRYVTDYLQPQENDAGLQDRGDCMMPTNAFLILTYLPDLVPSLDNVLPVLAVGKKYDIPIVIDNKGKSDARNFSVCFYVDDELIEKRGNVEVAGDGSIIERFSWTAPSTPGTIVEFKVEVDPDNAVEELINKYVNGELNNNATTRVAIDVGTVLPRPGGGGGGGGSGGGWGMGTGIGKGTGTGEGSGTAGGTGESTEREISGKTIRGRLMKGIVPSASQEAGGGGEGEFSLIGLLMRLGLLAVAIALVYVGYRYEKKIHKPEK